MQVGGVGGGFDPTMMQQMQQKMMSTFDADASETLNMEEFSSLHAKMDARRPEGVESPGSAEEIFNQIDTDGDGELTQGELQTFRENNPPPHRFGSDTMASLLAAQEQSENGWMSLVDALESDDDEASSEDDKDDDDTSSSYFEALSL